MPKATNNPPPRKSKKQVEAEFKQRQEVNRLRALSVEKIYPILLKHSKSISDATMMLMAVKQAIGTAFSNQKRVQTVDELKVADSIDPSVDRVEVFRELVECLRYEKILTAELYIEGLGNTIDSFLREELSKRPLSSVKTDFLPVIPESNGTVQK